VYSQRRKAKTGARTSRELDIVDFVSGQSPHGKGLTTRFKVVVKDEDNVSMYSSSELTDYPEEEVPKAKAPEPVAKVEAQPAPTERVEDGEYPSLTLQASLGGAQRLSHPPDHYRISHPMQALLNQAARVDRLVEGVVPRRRGGTLIFTQKEQGVVQEQLRAYAHDLGQDLTVSRVASDEGQQYLLGAVVRITVFGAGCSSLAPGLRLVVQLRKGMIGSYLSAGAILNDILTKATRKGVLPAAGQPSRLVCAETLRVVTDPVAELGDGKVYVVSAVEGDIDLAKMPEQVVEANRNFNGGVVLQPLRVKHRLVAPKVEAPAPEPEPLPPSPKPSIQKVPRAGLNLPSLRRRFRREIRRVEKLIENDLLLLQGEGEGHLTD
jgi:hypothetical protein